jgi:hypothetical protein
VNVTRDAAGGCDRKRTAATNPANTGMAFRMGDTPVEYIRIGGDQPNQGH